MAKKKGGIIGDVGALVGFSFGGEREFSDNNPSGVMDLPNYGTDPANYIKSGKMNMPSYVAAGGSPNTGDVNVVNANGIASSKGQGNNQEYNYWKGTDGLWNKNRDWDGSNRTGE